MDNMAQQRILEVTEEQGVRSSCSADSQDFSETPPKSCPARWAPL